MAEISTFAAQAAALPEPQRFPGLAYKAFAYAGDEEALVHLRKTPGVPQLFEWLHKHVVDEYYRMANGYNHLVSDDGNFPTLQRMLERCCAVLDLPVPELYVGYSAAYNAYTSGVTKPFIVLHSSLVDDFTPAEVSYIIGHELGHIKGRHVLYFSTAQFIIRFLPVLQSLIPVNVGIIQVPLLIAMFEWIRRAEMSCDRCGLLCVQDEAIAVSAQARLCGWLKVLPEEFNMERIVDQFHSVEDSDNALAKILLLLESSGRTHPFGAERLYRIRQFARGDKYQRILDGEYARETQTAGASGA